VGLDLVFVLALPLGVFGAAAASLISQLFAFLYCFLRMRKTEGIDLSRGRSRPLPGMQKEMLMLALPIALQYIVLSLGGIVLQSTVNVQGSVFVAGYTATTKLYGLLEAVSIALGMAFATFTAQNYGAGNFSRIKKGVYVSSLLCFLFALLFGALVLFLGEGLLSLFLDKGDPATPLALPIALRFLHILGAFLFVLYLIHIFRNVLQSMGISHWSLLSGFSECVVRILMAKVLILPFSTDALFFAEPAAWLGALLTVCIPYFFYQRKWRNPSHN
jgi:Na+-driven multidrug efflux pump